LIADKHGTSYVITTSDTPAAFGFRVSDADGRLVARAGFDKSCNMIVHLWVDPAKRRRGIAYALVKTIWREHPESVGHFPRMPMSLQMHGFLTALFKRENMERLAPGQKLKRQR
jgi:GNAT superfamily N-acetyltransferase